MIANTKNQKLDEHSFVVAKVAVEIYKRITKDTNKPLILSVYLSSLFHDISKVDKNFQDFLKQKLKSKNGIGDISNGVHINSKKGFTFDEYARHNEISYAIYKILNTTSFDKNIENVILYHHDRPLRRKSKKKFNTINEVLYDSEKLDVEDLIKKSLFLIDNLIRIIKDYNEDPSVLICLREIKSKINLDRDKLSLAIPKYKDYTKTETKDLMLEAEHYSDFSIIKSCLITADRLVSGTTYDLSTIIKNKQLDLLYSKIFNCDGELDRYLINYLENKEFKNERGIRQKELADNICLNDSLNDRNDSVLSGAAGCGKTKISLEYAKNHNAKKIIFVCPRVQVCLSLFNDLLVDVTDKDKCDNIEIFTGEYKLTGSLTNETKEDEYLTGDIIITTIDQISSTIVNHKMSNFLIDFMQYVIIFDEFHEYVSIPELLLLFIELVKIKEKSKSPSLLISATPNYTFLEECLGINSESVKEMPSFNCNKYSFDFDEYEDNFNNIFYREQNNKESTFVICNTAKTQQQSFIKNYTKENSILFHSKYTAEDRKDIFNKVYKSFNRKGSKEYNTLRSGPLVQASLNISCEYMITELSSAENIYQRIGRLDRFGDNKTGLNKCIISKAKDGRNRSYLFLKNMYIEKQSKVFYDFLKKNYLHKIFTLKDFYTSYKEFHSIHRGVISKELNDCLIASSKHLTETFDVQFSYKVRSKKELKVIGEKALRGNSVFVNMAIVKVDNAEFIHTDEYLTQDGVDIPITLNLSELSDDDKTNDKISDFINLRKYIEYSNANDYNKYTNTYNHVRYLSRFFQFPIYLSYTKNSEANKKDISESKYYYYTTEKQSVGVIKNIDEKAFINTL